MIYVIFLCSFSLLDAASRDEIGSMSLHEASRIIDIVDLSIQKGDNPFAIAPMQRVVKHGFTLAPSIILHGVVEHKSRHTALYMAALFDLGADPNAALPTGKKRLVPLQKAILNGNVEAVRKLLEHPDIDIASIDIPAQKSSGLIKRKRSSARRAMKLLHSLNQYDVGINATFAEIKQIQKLLSAYEKKKKK